MLIVGIYLEMTLDPLNEREYDLTTMVKVSDGSGDRSFEGDEKHLYETGVEKSVDKQLTMIATAMSLKEDETAVLRVKLKEELTKKLESIQHLLRVCFRNG